MRVCGQGGRKRKRSVLSIQAAEHKNACAVGNVSRLLLGITVMIITRLPQNKKQEDDDEEEVQEIGSVGNLL